jgi:DNA polymerase-3 subunit alpha
MTEQGELLRGLPVRFTLKVGSEAIGTYQSALKMEDEKTRFYPSDAALAGWMAEADQGKAVVVYE